MKIKTPYRIILIAAAIFILVALILGRFRILEKYREWKTEPVPPAVSLNEIDNTTAVSVPASINLDIPFTAQSPHGNWELPYQEACEEASSLMAARFLAHQPITDANDADTGITELVNYNVEQLNQPIDTTADETARLIEQFYGLQTEVVPFQWDAVKEALSRGYPVIIPAAGRELGNPYYTQPGPLYHMMVIKGYTPTKVITNDPGTKRGADYQYDYETIEHAVHDWNGGDVANGAKVMIIVQPAQNSQPSDENQ